MTQDMRSHKVWKRSQRYKTECDIYEICASPTPKIILATFQNKILPKKARKKKKLGENSLIKLSEMQ